MRDSGKVGVVTFYGTKDAMVGWKKLVEARCPTRHSGDVEKTLRDVAGIRWQFEAWLSELDCVELMKDWYETEAGCSMRWNCRVSFKKSWEKRRLKKR